MGGLPSRCVILLGFLAASAPGAFGQDVYVYPARGQSAQQQDRDRYECHGWAVQQTGFDPARASATPVAAPPPPPPPDYSRDGSLMRGAARGAAVGAVGGAIGGDAGKGAAIGAGAGALVGGVRRRDRIRQQEAQQQAYHQQQSAAAANQSSANAARRTSYNRALATCLQGRGYTVN